MDGVYVQPDDLSDQAPSYTHTADQVRRIRDALKSTLDGHGACWGNDDAGQMFASKYQGPADTAMTQLTNAGESLDGFVGNVRSWSQQYVTTDLDLTDIAKNLMVETPRE